MAFLFGTLAACGGGGSSTQNAAQAPQTALPTTTTTNITNITTNGVTLSGSVGDGPVTGALVTITDDSGKTLASVISDAGANYSVKIPKDALYPLTIAATGGTDIVTGTSPTFIMYSAVMGPDETQANINPFSTLIIATARAMAGGLNAANLEVAKQQVLNQFPVGLDLTRVPDPILTPITEQNVATIVKASEVLAEIVRRTRGAMNGAGRTLNDDGVMNILAADIVDGALDGAGEARIDPVVAATLNITTGQVLIEALGNQIKVNGVVATDQLDHAILVTNPKATQTTADLPVNAALIDHARLALRAARAVADTTALTDLENTIAAIQPEALPRDVEILLPPKRSTELNSAIQLVAGATSSTVAPANEVVKSESLNLLPTVVLQLDSASISAGDSITLSWSYSPGTNCSTTGTLSWLADQSSGSVTLGPLQSDGEFTLTCVSLSGLSNTATVAVKASAPVTDGTNGGTSSGGGTTDSGGTTSGSGTTSGGGTSTLVTGSTSNSAVKQVVASVTASSYDAARGRVPENAIDGDTTSKWTVLSMPQWIILDLGTTRAVSQVRMLMYGANAGQNMDFNIDVSTDNLNWTTTINHALPAESPQWTEANFGPIQARYLRISLNSSNTMDYANIYEIEVYGEDVSSTIVPSATLTLSWQPNADNVQGYVVYYGPTSGAVNTEASTIPITAPGVDPLAPSVQFNSWSDLGLLPGNNVCFAVRAYNADGLSNSSTPVCGLIPSNV